MVSLRLYLSLLASSLDTWYALAMTSSGNARITEVRPASGLTIALSLVLKDTHSKLLVLSPLHHREVLRHHHELPLAELIIEQSLAVVTQHLDACSAVDRIDHAVAVEVVVWHHKCILHPKYTIKSKPNQDPHFIT